MTIERMLEYLVIENILEHRHVRKPMSAEEFNPLYDRYKTLEDEFVNEYKLPDNKVNLKKLNKQV